MVGQLVRARAFVGPMARNSVFECFAKVSLVPQPAHVNVSRARQTLSSRLNMELKPNDGRAHKQTTKQTDREKNRNIQNKEQLNMHTERQVAMMSGLTLGWAPRVLLPGSQGLIGSSEPSTSSLGAPRIPLGSPKRPLSAP